MKMDLYNTYSRRLFLKQAGSFSASAIMAPSALTADVKEKFKLGLQLYSIRDAMAKDLRAAFKRIVEFGYQEVETYGFNYGK